MTILVTGCTGTIGSRVLARLCDAGADVIGLARDPGAVKDSRANIIRGDLADIGSMRAALKSIDTLFLLNAVSRDELTQALTMLNLAREENVRNLVYISVMKNDVFFEVPHFSAKYAVEKAADRLGFAATFLRCNYFMQNDLALIDLIKQVGVYPMPIGNRGLSMIDVDDIAEVATLELLRQRDNVAEPSQIINLAGPDCLSGPDVAVIWSDVLGRQVAYGGNDTVQQELQMRAFMPDWMAYDMRLMFEAFQSAGFSATDADVGRVSKMLGRPLRRYRELLAAHIS